MAIPRDTPIAISAARRPRWPTVSPSVRIAATGAKKALRSLNSCFGDEPREGRRERDDDEVERDGAQLLEAQG